MIKVLHLEDDADIREIADLALSISGEFDVLQCASGEEGLRQIEAFQPDVLLLDMMMPGMTGCEALEKIRETSNIPHVPAIFMTARAQHAEIEKLHACGAASVISKPFDPMSLGDQIKDVLEKHRLRLSA
ncbi:response regulator [Roseovarius sp. S4756]|uniref:response regulator n=1 Tax=Roseovarius maritimus TaxID=3342637 RepID=UPI003727D3EF